MDEIAAPPESELIERLRKAMPKDQSAVAKVAKLANISEGRWRQLAKGYQQATPTTRVPAKAPADTLARMAHVVGATVEQLREVGRADAADELDKLINWRNFVRPGFGVGSLRRRMELDQKPQSEWTLEDHEFKRAEQREHSRRAQASAEASGEQWPPPNEPASRPPAQYGLHPRSFEEIFNEWQVARAKLLNLQLEYAIGRKISPDIAATELADIRQMLDDGQYGRPWTPPWDPGAEFEEGDEPWKAEFWSYREALPSPFGGDGYIYQLGHTYDLTELRQKREVSARADEVWEEDARRQAEAYEQRGGDHRGVDPDLDAFIHRSDETRESAGKVTKFSFNAKNLTPNDAPPSEEELGLAARTAPPGYEPGQAEQGEAAGEESQLRGSSDG